MPRTTASNRTLIKKSENLLINSNNLSSGSWSRNNTTWLADQVANPVDGAITAGAWIDNSTNSTHFARQVNPASITSILNTMVCQSVFAKAGSKTFIALGANNGAAVSYFDLTNGIITSQQTGAFIQNYGNGWYRCSITYLITSATAVFYIANSDGVTSYSGAGDTAVYLYSPMINKGRSPALSTITTSTANTGPIRSYIWPQNLTARSNSFSFWSMINSTINDNSINDPLTGDMTAIILRDDTSNNIHGIGSPTTTPFSQDGVFCQSIFAKAAPSSTATILQFPTAAGGLISFDLINAIITTTADVKNAVMQNIGNGWYFCYGVYTTSTSNASPIGLRCAQSSSASIYTGSGNPCIYLTRTQIVYSNSPGNLFVTSSYPVSLGGVIASYPTMTQLGVRNNFSRTLIT